ncbi:unnamed protein product, partial [Urochloa humidicola]
PSSARRPRPPPPAPRRSPAAARVPCRQSPREHAAPSVDCRHTYEKGPVMHYIRSKKPPQCPIAGCPRVLQVGKVVCDPLLLIEFDELRSSEPAVPNATNIEDFTDLVDEDEE